jgi:dipeptidyl aminopeptidase/acylaminoacyl peptidase
MIPAHPVRRSHGFPIHALARSALASWLLAASAASQTIQLNGPFLGHDGTIDSPVFSADGTHVLYAADGSLPFLPWDFDLYSVPTAGDRTPIRLGGPFPPFFFAPVPGPEEPGLYVGSFRPALCDKRVIYVADENLDGRPELRSVPHDGSAASVVLSGSVTGSFLHFELSPDGVHALYWVSRLSPNDGYFTTELYSVAIDGSAAPFRLDESSGARLFVGPISPDGRHALYQALDSEGSYRLFVAALDGTHPSSEIELPRAGDGRVESPAFSDDATVLYIADQEVDERYELFSVPLAGGTPRKLSGPLVAGGNVGSFQLSADRRWLAYTAHDADGRHELYSRLVVEDGPIRRLDAPPSFHLSYRPSLDSSRVLFHAGDTELALFSVPIDGSRPATRLDGGRGTSGSHRESRDGQRIVFSVYTGERVDLYSAPSDGSSEPVNLGASLPPGIGVETPFQVQEPYWLLEDGVVFLAGERASRLDLYLAPLAGGEASRLVEGPVHRQWPPVQSPSPGGDPMLFEREEGLYALPPVLGMRPTALVTLPFGSRAGAVSAFEIAPDGEHVAYRANADQARFPELFGVRPTERLERVKLSPELDRSVDSHRFDPTGVRVVFVARELFSAPADGHAPAILLDAGLPYSGHVDPAFLITSDGGRVLYRADPDGAGTFDLRVVPIDGSAPAEILCSATSGLRVTPAVRLAPDGGQAFFLARRAGTLAELYRVSLDGGIPQRISQDLANLDQRTVQPDFQASPDGRWLAFRANPERRFVDELFVVPSGGSHGPVRLNAPLDNGADVLAFAIDARSRCVVYQADQDVRLQIELYSVALDGSGAPRRLNGALVPGGDVSSFQLSEDGDWVVYEADQDQDGAFELYRVPIDGRSLAVSLSGPLVAGGRLERFEISADGARVVYLADQEELGVRALYSAALPGLVGHRLRGLSRGVVRLSRELFPGGSAADFEISPDSRSVVFAAERAGYGLTLLRAPISGGEKAAEILPASVVANASVDGFRISPEGSRVLYFLRGPSTIDLFATALAPGPAAGPAR